MKFEEYAKFERARLEEARRKGNKTEGDRRREELLKQLAEMLSQIDGRLSRELADELGKELSRLA